MNNNCPRCRAQSNFTELDRNEDLYNKVKIKCCNFIRGCSEILLYSSVEDHLNNCLYTQYYCLGKNCDFNGKRDNFREHLNECGLFKESYKLITEPDKCCIYEQSIICLDCKENFVFREFNAHLRKCKLEGNKTIIEDLDEVVKRRVFIIIGLTNSYNILVISFIIFLYYSSKETCDIFINELLRTGIFKAVWVLFFLPLLIKRIREYHDLIRKTKIAYFTFFLVNAILCVTSSINFSNQMASIINNNTCKNVRIAFMTFLLVEWFYIIFLIIINCLANKMSD